MKRKVIIDTDPGIDDALALMLALASDELEVMGVTIAAGNVERNQCAQNALDILHLMGRDDIPVYYGASGPLKRKPNDARETHGANGIGNYELEKSPNKALEGATEFIRDTLNNNEDVSIIALGPLTNIANLIEKYPDAVENLKELVLMGGTFKSHGNCSPVAEFNFWFDPDSAKIVFDNLHKPITMTGLDVTRKVLFTPNYAELVSHFGNEKADAIVGMTKFYTDFHWDREGVIGCVINDPLAVAQFIDPTICSGKDCYVEIITDGPAIGMSMVDEMGILNREPNCKVLTDVDHKKFFKFFLSKIFPDQENTINMVLDDQTYGN